MGFLKVCVLFQESPEPLLYLSVLVVVTGPVRRRSKRPEIARRRRSRRTRRRKSETRTPTIPSGSGIERLILVELFFSYWGGG